MRVWTTTPLSLDTEMKSSPHLFKDCNVLVKREIRQKVAPVYEWTR